MCCSGRAVRNDETLYPTRAYMRGNVEETSKPMKTRRLRRGFLLVVTLSLTACTPGFSIDTISATPAAIVLEYSHSVNGELQAAIKTAEARCQQYGRHARMNGQPTQLNLDRSVATFDCVQ